MDNLRNYGNHILCKILTLLMLCFSIIGAFMENRLSSLVNPIWFGIMLVRLVTGLKNQSAKNARRNQKPLKSSLKMQDLVCWVLSVDSNHKTNLLLFTNLFILLYLFLINRTVPKIL